MRRGLYRVDTPGILAGFQIRCAICGCSVTTDHLPGGEECILLTEERRWKNQD